MTDKQIIIDGVDVSGCEYLDNIDFDGLCLMLSSPYECQVICSNKPNCYYKQLIRKEQECETLASQLDFEVQKKECLEQECETLKDENFHLRKEGKKSCAYCADLIAKEQECEGLRGDLYFTNEQLKDFKSHYDKAVEECENLREKYLELKEQNGNNIVQLNTVNEQLDQLKAENEELKEELEELKEENEYNEANAVEFKQTLTEIKEIAESLITTTDEYDSCYYKDRCFKCEVKEDCQYFKVEQILQKISECEGNDEN